MVYKYPGGPDTFRHNGNSMQTMLKLYNSQLLLKNFRLRRIVKHEIVKSPFDTFKWAGNLNTAVPEVETLHFALPDC